MGLFDKKFCSICGEKIGFLGNRKLEDGNLCKHCNKKLSRWFDERRHSTVAQIQEQLEYRAANQEDVNNFQATRTFGDWPVLHLDDANARFLIAYDSDFREENPDIVYLSQVKNCTVEIKESRHEEKQHLEDGREVSYMPPRYVWTYNFPVKIMVEHPFFDEMRFDLNRSNVRIESEDLRMARHSLGIGMDPRQHPDYVKYAKMAEELVPAILGQEQPAAQPVQAQQAVTCPFCGATTLPDAQGRCEYCGGAVNG